MQDLKRMVYTKVHLRLLNEESSDFSGFIDLVLQDIFAELWKLHMIPSGQALVDLKEELREEVIESTRKKIYGYHDIEHYKSHQKR